MSFNKKHENPHNETNNSSYKSDNTNDDTNKKEDYRIAICQDGKFAITFDTANLRIKILENTDHRTFNMKESDNKKSEKSDPPSFNQESKLNTGDDDAKEDEKSDAFRWSFDVSNLHKNDDEYYILVTKSLNLRKNWPSSRKKRGAASKKGIAFYRLELKEEKKNYIFNNVTCYYSDSISGICSFIEVTNDDDVEQRRFIIFNFHDELDNWYTDSGTDCMKRLLTCVYDKYFLVTQYKNDVQSLEVAKRVEDKEKYVKQYNYDTFSVSKLQLCFTRGINIIKLYYMENGLQIASKKFDEIEKIFLLEFIDNDENYLL
ncbi:hypothetical protein GLOIN_2v1773283 [Rhizophagus irregularis DAOM 181602=DAOM 197198]|uniref:Uncharacterized protein n=1 Tax=Rhizophagus irregularis (strain DAOM 181602 / DAOM 197198 / MUCL 43194) TaxID=747089 RepID=A0A2P4Q5A1_RHIID|nr:hypothetical protein GLOIN_2v1773283 [Rhizophagus irregularis DAOM 181602=DAOM 197198]POG72820.1 hypothetical protein GLOIN_2v1773283 [Rhizophagus irregularis DAOM 181602=DAOM 197198]|eukprot:XP_025179686.1 hypothetical protein GLOIN_2v1773283 [Rhizophagus irregularis DAOM 181602=DAOM 197198]